MYTMNWSCLLIFYQAIEVHANFLSWQFLCTQIFVILLRYVLDLEYPALFFFAFLTMVLNFDTQSSSLLGILVDGKLFTESKFGVGCGYSVSFLQTKW